MMGKDKLEDRIRAHGFELIYQESCENSRTPSFLGPIKGVTDWDNKEVRIGLKANPTDDDILETLAHELRHLDEPDWDCGNLDVFGRGGSKK